MLEYLQFRLIQRFQGHKFQKIMLKMTSRCPTCAKRMNTTKRNSGSDLGVEETWRFFSGIFPLTLENFCFLFVTAFEKWKHLRGRKVQKKNNITNTREATIHIYKNDVKNYWETPFPFSFHRDHWHPVFS